MALAEQVDGAQSQGPTVMERLQQEFPDHSRAFLRISKKQYSAADRADPEGMLRALREVLRTRSAALGRLTRDFQFGHLQIERILVDCNFEEDQARELLRALFLGLDKPSRPQRIANHLKSLYSSKFSESQIDEALLDCDFNVVEATKLLFRQVGEEVPRGKNVVRALCLDGRHVDIEVNPSDTVEQLKRKIDCQREGFLGGELRLIFAGRNLSDDYTLADYNIGDDCGVYALSRITIRTLQCQNSRNALRWKRKKKTS